MNTRYKDNIIKEISLLSTHLDILCGFSFLSFFILPFLLYHSYYIFHSACFFEEELMIYCLEFLRQFNVCLFFSSSPSSSTLIFEIISSTALCTIYVCETLCNTIQFPFNPVSFNFDFLCLSPI